MSATGEMAIVQRLLAQSSVTALVGQRIWPHVAPQGTDTNTLDYIVYHAVDKVHEQNLRGASGVCFARLQLDVFASSYARAKAIVEAIRMCIEGYRGDVTVGSDIVRVVHCSLELEVDEFDPPIDGSQRGRHRMILDYKVGYEETIPAFAGL